MAGPLEGLKILDFSTLLPGPWATMIMADMGADVLRLEAIKRPDLMRTLPPFVAKNISATHATVNRNKRSLAIDLKQPEAIKIVKKLVKEYDVVVEQFRPGVMKRLGLDYDTLKAENPQLIYCSITGYGQTGPLKDRAGHDINYLALSGLASHTGRKDSGPVPPGVQVADIAGGSHHAVMGILAALYQRQASGVGQYIDISMADAALALNGLNGATYLSGAEEPGYETETLNGGLFYDFYRTSDNQYISIGSLEPQFAIGLFQALGHPEWAARAADFSAENQQQLKQDIQQVIGNQTRDYWADLFGAADFCVEPVLSLGEATEHEHFQAREMVVDVPLNDGSLQQLAHPIKYSSSQPEYRSAGAKLGEHTAATLEQAGFSAADIDSLYQQGIVA
ncbi:CaiB/BaiF CoA transferase family protein [Spongorhabdus nitratireducens]